MSFAVIVSTIASIVSIIGGVIGIVSALSKEPIFSGLLRRKAHPQPLSVSQSAPAPKPSGPFGKAPPSDVIQGQPRTSSPAKGLRFGMVCGLVAGGLSVLILSGLQTLYLQTRSGTFGILELIGLGSLSIVVGILPSRVSGSLFSSIIAGGVLGLCTFLTTIIYSLLVGLRIDLFPLYFVLYGVLPFLVSVLFGLLGRYLYKRFQVPQL